MEVPACALMRPCYILIADINRHVFLVPSPLYFTAPGSFLFPGPVSPLFLLSAEPGFCAVRLSDGKARGLQLGRAQPRAACRVHLLQITSFDLAHPGDSFQCASYLGTVFRTPLV